MSDIVRADEPVEEMLSKALKAKPKDQLKALIRVAVIQSIEINRLRGEMIDATKAMKELAGEMRVSNQINDSPFRHTKMRDDRFMSNEDRAKEDPEFAEHNLDRGDARTLRSTSGEKNKVRFH